MSPSISGAATDSIIGRSPSISPGAHRLARPRPSTIAWRMGPRATSQRWAPAPAATSTVLGTRAAWSRSASHTIRWRSLSARAHREASSQQRPSWCSRARESSACPWRREGRRPGCRCRRSPAPGEPPPSRMRRRRESVSAGMGPAESGAVRRGVVGKRLETSNSATSDGAKGNLLLALLALLQESVPIHL